MNDSGESAHPGRADSNARRMVFYGRTNRAGDDGAKHIARQFRQCTHSLSRRGLINHVHCDSRPVREPLLPWIEDLVRGAGCPRYRDGGRVDLFAASRSVGLGIGYDEVQDQLAVREFDK